MTTAVLEHSAQLEKVLLEHGVTVFGYERLGDLAVVRFSMGDRKFRLVVPMPDWNDRKYTTTEQGRIRAVTARRELYWRDIRTKWAAMKNLISAKLEAIEAGITTVDAEFSQFVDGVAALGSGEK